MNDVHYRWDCPKQTVHVFLSSTITVSCNFYLSLGTALSNRRVGKSQRRIIFIQSPITLTKTLQCIEFDTILCRCLTIVGNYAVGFSFVNFDPEFPHVLQDELWYRIKLDLYILRQTKSIK